MKPTIGSTLSKLSKSTSSPVAPRLAQRCRVIMTTQPMKQRMPAATTWRGRILKFQHVFDEKSNTEPRGRVFFSFEKKSFRFNSQLGPSYNCGCCVSCKKRLRVPSLVPSHHPVINSHNPATPKRSLLNPCLWRSEVTWLQGKSKKIYPCLPNEGELINIQF